MSDEDEDITEDTAGQPVTLTDDELEAVLELRHLRAERKDIEEREKQLRAEILQRLEADHADRALTASGHTAVKLRKQVRRTVNSTELQALYPEVYAEVMTENEVIILDLP